MLHKIIIRANGCWTSNCLAQSIYKLFLKNRLSADVKFVNSNHFDDAYEMARYDYMIFEGCSVTINLEMMVIELFRKIKRINPNIKIFVSGCGAKNKQSIYYKLSEVDNVFPHYSELVNYFVKIFPKCVQNEFKEVKLTNHVLVKKGCRRLCSYCIVPFIRTPVYNKSMGDILKEIKFLQKKGFENIKLTGLCISSWRRNGISFKYLLEKILNEIKIKVSVYEFHPKDIDDKLMHLLSNKNMDRNISIPLQSGSNKLLRLMNRGYSVEHVDSLYTKLIKKMPDIKINTELMFGFPYETEEDFDMTNGLFNRFPFNNLARIQVYPFSPRPFTRAAKFPQISIRVIKYRIDKFCNDHNNLPIIKYGTLELDKKIRNNYFNLIREVDN